MKLADLTSSLVVFIIAIPLSLGISIASGASVSSGIISGIVGGIVVGALAGAPLVVTGAAAGLTAFVFQIIQDFGIQGLTIITVLCGLVQILFGVFKLGNFFAKIPKPVLEGVLSAIGAIILVGQLHVMMGGAVPKTAWIGLQHLPEAVVNLNANWKIAIIGLFAAIIQIIWPKVFRRFAWIPGALPAVVLATLISLLFPVPRVVLGDLLPQIVSSVHSFFSTNQLNFFSSSFMKFFPTAIGLAVIASAETLLTARGLHVMLSTHEELRMRHAPLLDKELIAQGAGNCICAMLGGLPMTGVMVRSAANVTAGGRTRFSSILHGIWILLFVHFFPEVLTKIPLSVLASILVLTGIKLLNLKNLIHEIKKKPLEGMLWILTMGAVFMTDLLKGLVIGIVSATLIYLVTRLFFNRKAA